MTLLPKPIRIVPLLAIPVLLVLLLMLYWLARVLFTTRHRRANNSFTLNLLRGSVEFGESLR